LHRGRAPTERFVLARDPVIPPQSKRYQPTISTILHYIQTLDPEDQTRCRGYATELVKLRDSANVRLFSPLEPDPPPCGRGSVTIWPCTTGGGRISYR
jgi:hypothetical protein